MSRIPSTARRIGASTLSCLATAALLAGCTFEPPSRPTPPPTPEPTPSPTPEATPVPTPTPEPTPTPTPQPEAPDFEPGELVATTTGALRVRRLPGTDRSVVETLPEATLLLVLMGPILADGYGWYLVRDADPGEPEFDEGWVSAGHEPDPFLRGVAGTPEEQPVLAGYAHDGDATHGPISIGDGDHRIRWIAASLESPCSFHAALGQEPGEGTTVGVASSVGVTPTSGHRHPDFFDQHPGLRGDVFLSVSSDCSWAVTILRVPEDEEEEPE